LHDAKNLTRLPAQSQFFSRGRFAGARRRAHAQRQKNERDGDGSKALNAAGIFRPKEPNFQNSIGAARLALKVKVELFAFDRILI